MGWNSFSTRKDHVAGDASRVQQEAMSPPEEEENLAGVGIVFVKAPDDSLFVKKIIEGSAACHSGIQPGDCLMKVDGKNVYCRGIDVATRMILGPAGSVVNLKFGRIEKKKRVAFSAALVREMKASSHPQWQINTTNSMTAGLRTSQFYLECMQKADGKSPEGFQGLLSTPPLARMRSVPFVGTTGTMGVRGEEDGSVFGDDKTTSSGSSYPMNEEEDDGAGVWVSKSGTESSSRASAEEEGGAGAGRKIWYKGKWYAEQEIAEMEEVAKELSDKIAALENGATSARSADEIGWGGHVEEAAATAGLGGKVHSAPPGWGAELKRTCSMGSAAGPRKREPQARASVDQDPEALGAAIFVVQGGELFRVAKRKFGVERKRAHVRVSTGGLMTWGQGKSAHVMRVSRPRDLYDPKMSKGEYRDRATLFSVVLEGEKVFAHSNTGGQVKAVEGKTLDFTAETQELRDKWVMGIKAVLEMAKRESDVRSGKARMVETQVDMDKVSKSVFITQPLPAEGQQPNVVSRTASLPTFKPQVSPRLRPVILAPVDPPTPQAPASLERGMTAPGSLMHAYTTPDTSQNMLEQVARRMRGKQQVALEGATPPESASRTVDLNAAVGKIVNTAQDSPRFVSLGAPPDPSRTALSDASTVSKAVTLTEADGGCQLSSKEKDQMKATEEDMGKLREEERRREEEARLKAVEEKRIADRKTREIHASVGKIVNSAHDSPRFVSLGSLPDPSRTPRSDVSTVSKAATLEGVDRGSPLSRKEKDQIKATEGERRVDRDRSEDDEAARRKAKSTEELEFEKRMEEEGRAEVEAARRREAQQRKERDERAKQESEALLEAEAKARREEAERAKQEAEALREAEERARREDEERAKQAAEALREAEEKARREEAERAKQAAERLARAKEEAQRKKEEEPMEAAARRASEPTEIKEEADGGDFRATLKKAPVKVMQPAEGDGGGLQTKDLKSALKKAGQGKSAATVSEIDKALANKKPVGNRDRVSDKVALAVAANVVTSVRAGGGDLAAMLAARQKKQQEAEENDDGYYFD